MVIIIIIDLLEQRFPLHVRLSMRSSRHGSCKHCLVRIVVQSDDRQLDQLVQFEYAPIEDAHANEVFSANRSLPFDNGRIDDEEF